MFSLVVIVFLFYFYDLINESQELEKFYKINKKVVMKSVYEVLRNSVVKQKKSFIHLLNENFINCLFGFLFPLLR
jgi:hypothetical protein